MEITAEHLNQPWPDHLPTAMGIKVIEIRDGHSLLEMQIKSDMLNLYKVVHGGAVVALADTAAGFGTYASLPENAAGFTTVELKCNFLGGSQEGLLSCTGKRLHNGKSTQVWDATVVHCDTGKTVAEFRCTNMILYSQP